MNAINILGLFMTHIVYFIATKVLRQICQTIVIHSCAVWAPWQVWMNKCMSIEQSYMCLEPPSWWMIVCAFVSAQFTNYSHFIANEKPKSFRFVSYNDKIFFVLQFHALEKKRESSVDFGWNEDSLEHGPTFWIIWTWFLFDIYTTKPIEMADTTLLLSRILASSSNKRFFRGNRSTVMCMVLTRSAFVWRRNHHRGFKFGMGSRETWAFLLRNFSRSWRRGN